MTPLLVLGAVPRSVGRTKSTDEERCRRSRLTLGGVTAFLILTLACGGGGGRSTPTAPTPAPTPSPTVTSVIVNGPGCAAAVCTGTVGATLQLTATAQLSNSTAQSVTSQAQWASSSPNVATVNNAGLVNFRAAGDSDITATYQGQQGGVTIRLANPAGPRTSFGTGQHLVGRDIAAGRYFTNPVSGCYWERLRGLGGTLADIIANDFVSFDAGQLIVDIAAADLAFSTDDECRTWSTNPSRGFQTTITPGTWLRGSQVAPGTYRATASPGCYWERLRDFSGTLNGIISNDFVSGGGQVFVTIGPGDAGFNTDDECGTWTPTQTLAPATTERDSEQPLSEVEANRRRNRAQSGVPLP